MPFTKIGPDKYTSPSGKVYTEKQVRAYYATNGFKRAPKKNPGLVGRSRLIRGKRKLRKRVF